MAGWQERLRKIKKNRIVREREKENPSWEEGLRLRGLGGRGGQGPRSASVTREGPPEELRPE